ncbi:MAG: hypothetical protein ABH857_00720, partial [Elusimicrobiota bacterium]
MKKSVLRLLIQILIVFQMTVILSADTPQGKVNYQGRLEKDGEVVSGVKNIEFKIYDTLTGGNLIWVSGQRNVEVIQGFFNYPLGENNPLPTALFGQKELYLEIVIESTVMTPREEILIPPFAIRAGVVDWNNIENIPAGFADGTDDGGAALGQNTVGSYQIIDGSITANDIKDGEILTSKIANGAVTDIKITDVDWSKIINMPAGFADGTDDGSATLGKDSIGSYQIIDSTITTLDILNGTIIDADVSNVADIAASKLQSNVMIEGENVSLLNNDAGYLATISGENISQLTNDAGYLTSLSEIDPIYSASASTQVTQGKIDNWQSAFGWGNHALVGYLTTIAGENISSLTNDANYITINDTVSYVAANSIGANQIIDGSITSADLSSTEPISVTKLSNVVMIEGENVSLLNNDAGYLATISGENISQLTNDSGYLSSIYGLNVSTLTNDAG